MKLITVLVNNEATKNINNKKFKRNKKQIISTKIIRNLFNKEIHKWFMRIKNKGLTMINKKLKK